RIAACDARSPACADFDLDYAERLQGAQCVPRDDAADPGALGDVFLRAEEVARGEALLEQRKPHVLDDPGGERRTACGLEFPRVALAEGNDSHRLAFSANVKDDKDDIFSIWRTPVIPRRRGSSSE